MDDDSGRLDLALREEGQRWRAQAPDSIQVDESWFTSSNRENGIRALLVSGAAVVALAVLVVLVFPYVVPRDASDGLPPTPVDGVPGTAVGPGTATTVAPSLTASPPITPEVFPIVTDGQRVVAEGFLLASDAGEATMCPIAIAPAVPGARPTCVGPTVRVTLTADHRALVDGYVRLEGTWQAGSLAADSGSPATYPSRSRPKVPCQAPAAGWPGNGSGVESEAAIARLGEYVSRRPDTYAGTWTAVIPDHDDDAIVVATTSDPALAVAELRPVFSGNLCVVRVTFSGRELRELADHLRSSNPGWEVTADEELNRVAVIVPVVDSSTAEILEPHRELIDLRPIVLPQ